MPHRFYISSTGYDDLKNELNYLRCERMPEILDAVSRARAHGDLRENGEYQAAKQLQRVVNDRINYLSNLFKNATIIDINKEDKHYIRFGSWVSIKDEEDNVKKFKIVGEYESNIEKSFFSISSPIVRACIGKKICDIFSVQSPGGEREYEIISIEYD